MIDRANYSEFNVDKEIVRTILIVRNYYQYPEMTDFMWNFMKSEHNLFDFKKIVRLNVSDENYEIISDDAKMRQMRDSWGCSSNAMYAHYLDDGVKYGIELTTNGILNNTVIQRLANQYPELELLLITMPKNQDMRWATSVLELKGTQSRSFRLPSGEFTTYLFLKAIWGKEFSLPLAYCISSGRVVFLDQPEEQNYVTQTQRGIFYATHVKSVFDLEPLKDILTHSQLSVDENGDAPTEIVYINPHSQEKTE